MGGARGFPRRGFCEGTESSQGGLASQGPPLIPPHPCHFSTVTRLFAFPSSSPRQYDKDSPLLLVCSVLQAGQLGRGLSGPALTYPPYGVSTLQSGG